MSKIYFIASMSTSIKDTRYSRVKALIEAKHIKEFNEIFMHIPKSIVFKDMGIGYSAFTSRFENLSLYSISELRILAAHIEIDVRILIEMILLQIESEEKPKKSKAKG